MSVVIYRLVQLVSIILRVILPLGLLYFFSKGLFTYTGSGLDYTLLTLTGGLLLLILAGRTSDQIAYLVTEDNYDECCDGGFANEWSYAKKTDAKDAILFIPPFNYSTVADRIMGDYLHEELGIDYYTLVPTFLKKPIRCQKDKKLYLQEKEIREFVELLLKEYDHVYLHGFSIGGAITLKINYDNCFDDRVTQLATAPAWFNATTKPINFLLIFLLSPFISFCNWPVLKLDYPPYTSVDEIGKITLQREKSYYFISILSGLELALYDFCYRSRFIHAKQPSHIWLSDDDSRLNSLKVKATCDANSEIQCKLMTGGNHGLHWGSNREEYRQDVVNLITQKRAVYYKTSHDKATSPNNYETTPY